METSASFEARYAPLSYPTVDAHVRIYAGLCQECAKSAMLYQR
jgi:hypothetical protein